MRVVQGMSLALVAALSLGVAAQAASEADEASAKKAPRAAAGTPSEAAAKKPAPKKAAPKAAAKPAKKGKEVAPGVTRSENAKDVPVIRDAQGNPIPTWPEAYDVSSAMGKKK